MFDIPQELKKLPNKTGVYIMKDENNAVIYVGKAVNLHNRVRSYFQESSAHDMKVRSMAPKIDHFEYLVTDSEMEAFILESNLIKLHRPKYNIRLKDDKHYPYIKITAYEKLPRIVFSRERKKDNSKYFGPYIAVKRVHEILELIHRLWPIRRCQKVFPRDYEKGRPCLNHHIGQCKAPCMRLISEETYNQYISEAERFIQGKTEEITKKLYIEMTECAEQMLFERAAEIRNLLESLRCLSEKQKADTCDGNDRDIIAMAKDKNESLMQVFFVRDGKMTSREHFMVQYDEEEYPDGDILAAFVKQFYGEAAFIPKELVLISEPSEREQIARWLSKIKGRQVEITVPQKGEKKNLVQLAQTNAELTLAQFGGYIKKEAERNKTALADLMEILGIETPLNRIEAYDISNIQGYESVGSMIVFENGKAKNSDYRKFKLKAVAGPDDYAGMEEIITRRLLRFRQEHAAFSKLPDIIFVDGGKGQISAAEKALNTVDMRVPVCGMVKDDKHRTRGLLYNNTEVALPRSSEGFKLVSRIQDEVHRFALEYHRKLRANSQVRSVLDEIPGIGPARRKALIKHFKNIEAIRNAEIEQLTEAPAMNKRCAEAVYRYFKENP